MLCKCSGNVLIGYESIPTIALQTNINKDAFFWPTNVNKKEAGSDVTTNQRVREMQVANSQPTTVLGWQ